MLLALAALPLLAAAAVVAISLDDPGVEALPDRPTTLPPRPAPPVPEDSRTLDPADIQAALLTAEEIEELLERQPELAPPTASQPDETTQGLWSDRFGTVHRGPAPPAEHPLPAGSERTRFFSSRGGFSFLFPTGWAVQSVDPGNADLVLVLSNQQPGTRLEGPADEAMLIQIVYVQDPRSFDPVTLERRPAPTLEERLAEDDTPLSVGWRRLDNVNGRLVLRFFGSEAGDVAAVLFDVDGRTYGVSTEDVDSVYLDVLEEVIQSMEFSAS